MRNVLLFILSGLAFVAHQSGVFRGFFWSSFADCYLDPFLLMPIILQLRHWELIFLNMRERHLSVKQVLTYTLSVSFVGEVLFPIFSDQFTADIRDVAAYFSGSLLYLSINAGLNKRRGWLITLKTTGKSD